MNSIFKKFLQFAFGSGVALLLGFFSSPIISRLITDPAQTGLFSVFNITTSLLCLVILVGFDQAYARFFFEEEEENRKGLLKECLRIPLTIWGALAIICLILYKPISISISNEVNFQLVLLLVFHILFRILVSFALLVIRMKQRGKIFSLIQIITKVSYILFVLGMFSIYKNNYRSLVLGLFLSNVFILIFAIAVEYKEWNIITEKVKIKTSRRMLIQYAFPLLFAATISWVLTSADIMFLKGNNMETEVGLYGTAFSIISILIACQSAFSTFWVPVANEKYITNPEDKDFFSRVSSYIVVGMCTVAVLLIGGKDIIIYILGSTFRSSKYIIPFLSFIPIMYTISEVTGVGISFKRKTKYNAIIAIISAISNIVGNYILVPILGGRGAAISTGISYILFFALRTYFSVRLYNVQYNLRRLSILIVSMIVFATYSTFNSLDIVIILMTIANLILIVVLYRDVVMESITAMRKVVNSRIKNK